MPAEVSERRLVVWPLYTCGVCSIVSQQLREASEQRKELERQHAEALAQLREKKDEVNRLNQLSENDKRKSDETVEALQSKIRELEKKTELQNVRHEELMLELTALKRSQQSTVRASSSRHSSLGHSPPDSPLCSTPDSVLSRGESTTALSTPVVPSLDAILEQQHQSLFHSAGIYPRGHPTSDYVSGGVPRSLHLQDKSLELHETFPSKSSFSPNSPSLVATGVSHSLPRTHKSSFSPLRHGRKRLRRSTSVTDLTQVTNTTTPSVPSVQHTKSRHTILSQKSLHFDDPIASNHEIERIIAKIQQDNKILAELDMNAVYGSCPDGYSTQPPDRKPAPRRRTLPKNPSSSKYRQIPKIKINDEDERCTSRDLSGIYEASGILPSGSASVQALQAIGGLPQFQQIATVLPTNFFPVIPAGHLFTSQGPTLQQQATLAHQQQQLHQAALQGSAVNNPTGLVHQPIAIPTIITTAHVDNKTVGIQQPQVMNGSGAVVLSKQHQHHQQQQLQHHQQQHHHHQQQQPQTMNAKNVDMLDIPGKGRCCVYIARYSYDPFQQSPNENPEAELYLNAGDYVLVWGNMDEDGFLDGELLDGRRGLVPSNYVERLVGEDLLEFHQQVVLGIKDTEDCLSTSLLDFDHHPRDLGDESQRLIIATNKRRVKRTLPPLTINHKDVFKMREELMHRRQEEYGYLDLEDIMDDEGDPEKQVPPPVQLTLERQLNKSILIGWNPPDCPPGTIDCYQVYVNGLLRCTVKANERTRALVEGVDCNRPHRISVRSVTPNRRSSRDAACTMVIGKDAPLAPSCVRASGITSTSAVISWLPSNSNYQHVVCVNNVEIRTVKPGVYRHTITGLTPNTTYRVTVRSKNIKAPHFDEKSSKQMEKLSSHTEFRTLPKGLPDPPVDVQVEPGPQNNTILVTWHPVTAGTSNGAVVTGYAVFADGRKILEIDSPSGDHALLDLNRFQGVIPKQVTVRTKCRDSLSSDSIPIIIPAQVLKGRRQKMEPPLMPTQNSLPRGRMRHPAMEGEENFSDRELGAYHMMPPLDIDRPGPGRMHQAMGGRFPPPDPRVRPMPPPPDRPITARGYHPPHPPGHPGPPHPGAKMPLVDDFYARARGGARRPGRPTEVRHRLFVALFDYDPQSMSPNPDACEEELPFREGNTIKIYGEKDADGFYWGEANGRRGYVPCNMVSEIPADEDRMGQEFLNEGGEPLASGRERRAMGRDRWGDIYANMPVKKMVALYDYDPQELSPNVDSEVELSFVTGDIIYVYGDMDDDGFYMGELNGVRGLVPSNFLTEAPPDYEGGVRGGRRPMPPHLGPQDHRRPPGPGARGPPPPPREGAAGGHGPPHPRDERGIRKDASYPLDHSELKNHYDGQVDPRGGRPGGAGRGRGGPGSSASPGHPQGPDGKPHPNRPGRGAASSLFPDLSPLTDLPPDLLDDPLGDDTKVTSTVTSTTTTTGISANPITSKLPGVLADAPGNLMQKFSDLTHAIGGGGATSEGGEGGGGGGSTSAAASAGGAAAAAAGSVLSKGKDLIFKRFGL